jgi:di/tricarboxylate transporter
MSKTQGQPRLLVISVLRQIAGGPDAAPINLGGMTMPLQFVVSFGFILPVSAPQNMVAYGTDTFTARDFVRTGLVLTVIGFALVLLLGATYWQWMEYLTK